MIRPIKLHKVGRRLFTK